MPQERTITIHPSGLDLLARCPMSMAVKGEAHGSEHTHFGRACHEAAANKGRTGMFDADKIAQSNALSNIEKGMMMSYVGNIEMDYPEGTLIEHHVEVSFRAQSGLIIVLSCTPDVVIPEFPDGTGKTVIDYKFGRGDVSEDTLQTPAYLLAANLKPEGGSTIIVQPAAYAVKQKYYDSNAMKAFVGALETIAERASANKGEYCRGYHCDKYYCSKRETCPAYLSEVRTLMAAYKEAVPACTPEMLFRAYSFKNQLTQMASRIESMTDSYIQQHGPIVVGNDVLDAIEVNGRDEIDAEKALEQLRLLHGTDAIKAFSASKQSITEFVSDRIKSGDAQRGAIKKTLDALTQCGAFKSTTRKKLVYMKQAITTENNNETNKRIDGGSANEPTDSSVRDNRSSHQETPVKKRKTNQRNQG